MRRVLVRRGSWRAGRLLRPPVGRSGDRPPPFETDPPRRGRGAAALGLAVLLAGLAASVGASAQRTASVPLPPAVPRTPEPPPPPPYQGRIDRLAELMGTLAYLRDLCGEGDGGAWRNRMDALLSAEGGTAVGRERLAGSFNRGFEGYQLTYRACTPAAETVIARALAEGTRLSDALAAQFGTP